MQTEITINPVNMDNLPTPPPRTINYPSSPDWSFAGNDEMCLSSAYNVIQQSESWTLLINFKEESFMFSKDPAIINLMTKVDNAYNNNHSGASMGCTMRVMEYIAKNGFNAYVHLRRSKS